MPLYVRAGAILPLGPQIEYATQDAGGPIELRIYRGADGAFDLYDDSGDGYGYEHGEHSVTRLKWEDASGTLTLGTREGAYPGLPEKRKFRVVLVGKGQGGGGETTTKIDKEFVYEGRELRVVLR